LAGTAAAGAAIAMPEFFSFSQAKAPAINKVSSDLCEVVLAKEGRFRILQLTDTHFGTPTAENRLKDEGTRKLIRSLVDDNTPDLVFHTGDFINNDKENAEHTAIGFMNDLGAPWAVALGNHDHANGKAGQISFDDYYSRMKNSLSGFKTKPGGGKDQCYRIDLRVGRKPAFASIFAFNCGDPQSGMIINATQTAWFEEQIESDKKAGRTQPIIVMQHIPTVEFKTLFDQKLAIGRKGEDVCFELDKGEIFSRYVASGRVKAIFCGHDHVNDYIGALQGIRLVYGRCSGFSGYGDWQRGGRTIDLNSETGRVMTKVVLGRGSVEKAEWSETLKEMAAG
jgi:predicted MPP superfamily phosphohydrolase